MQELFITQLKQVIPKNISLVDELSDLLEVSNDSAYRRLRCETEITLDEAYKICKHYRISADTLFGSNANAVTATYIKLNGNDGVLENYLTTILNNLKEFAKQNNGTLIYAAEEIPIFHSFYSEKLASFKLFYWQRSVLNIPSYQSEKYSKTLISNDLMNISNQIHQAYAKINAIEIWTHNTIQTTIKQVEYCFETGVFENKDEAISILEELKSMLKALALRCEGIAKNNTIDLYYSEVIIGTNCIHVKLDNETYSRISFNNINSLSVNNTLFCDEIEQWMRNLIKKSTLITGVSEKQRFQFFNALYKSIDAVAEKIKTA